jgi:hypothetical protein
MTEESVKRYPLEWPVGWKRSSVRVHGKFRHYKNDLTIAQATDRLENELTKLGVKNPTLSTNVSLRLDGRPRGDSPKPTDPGAAIYFTFKGRASVLACDTYTDVAQNIAALAAHLEALRTMQRHGVGTIEQALAGYKALPADTAADWRAVFGFPKESRPTVDEVTTRYHAAAKERHPDVGGTEIEMAHLNRARDYALMELEP